MKMSAWVGIGLILAADIAACMVGNANKKM
jgi:hypothetical protein